MCRLSEIRSYSFGKRKCLILFHCFRFSNCLLQINVQSQSQNCICVQCTVSMKTLKSFYSGCPTSSAFHRQIDNFNPTKTGHVGAVSVYYSRYRTFSALTYWIVRTTRKKRALVLALAVKYAEAAVGHDCQMSFCLYFIFNLYLEKRLLKANFYLEQLVIINIYL